MSKRSHSEQTPETADPVVNGTVETKEEKFIRLAPRRVQRAIKALAAVRRLGARNTYRYTEAQRERIVSTLVAQVAMIDAAFRGQGLAPDVWDF